MLKSGVANGTSNTTVYVKTSLFSYTQIESQQWVQKSMNLIREYHPKKRKKKEVVRIPGIWIRWRTSPQIYP